MKNIKHIIQLLVLSVLIVSCDDSLNQEPRQSISLETAISSPANIRSLLLGAYDESGQVASYGGRSQLIADLLGNTGEFSWQGTFIDPRQLNNKSVLVSNGFVAGNWNNNYEVINQVNLVIDNSGLFTNAAEKSRIEGEAKFLRALAYFDLVRNFGKQYMAGGANTQPGVPLRLKGITDHTSDLSIARNTVQEVYNQILSDLNDAYANLPNTNGIFADKYAARALQARVYLQQGNYPAARDAANDVIANSGHSLAGTYAGAFNNTTNSSEDLFAFQVTDQTGANGLITFYASEANGGRGGDIVISAGYYTGFDAFGTDQRSRFFTQATGSILTAKYTNQFANVSVFRLAEMYLIRAEANLRASTMIGATPLADVNAVRARSGAPALPAVTLALIARERTFELAFEGFAIHDFRRTGTNVGAINYDADRLVLPIPQSEIDANSKMTQNSGY